MPCSFHDFKELHHPPLGAWFVAVFASPPGLGPVPKHSSKGAAVWLPVLRLHGEVGNWLGLGSCDDVKERFRLGCFPADTEIVSGMIILANR